MLRINSLLNVSQSDSPQSNLHGQLSLLAKKAVSFQLLQKYWASAADQLIAENSFIGPIKNNQLTVYAHNALIASKIKLLLPALLIKLQQLQQSQPLFREYKVSAIIVKVQVKSALNPMTKTPRKLSFVAADNLKTLADSLGETPLSVSLKSLAAKA